MLLNEKVGLLIADFHSKDGLLREKARKAIVRIGRPAVPALLEALSVPNDFVRWEACKALGAIRDPRASTALVHSLVDDNMEVRWLAAEGLIALGVRALVPLLVALEAHFENVLLRQGAHHVLHALERKKLLNKKTQAVLDTLRCLEPEAPVATAAREALRSLETLRD
jgi:hypothetical protein